MLKALASGGTGWSLHARTLRIIPAQAVSQKGVHDDNLVDLLAAALASLPRIQAVVWHVHAQDHWAWGRTAVLAFVNTLATLQELELNIPCTINLSALQVRSLRKFTFKSQGHGSSWGLSGSTPLPLLYQDIAQLVSQNRLNSLHLEGTTEWSAIWRLLRSRVHDMRLAEITTTVVTQDLFDYLTSYSGLEKLTLRFPDGGNPNASNSLADTFFETILPHHAESLTELSCPAAYESRFSFGTHNVNAVSLLHKLTRLEMSINASPVQNVQTYIDENGGWEPSVTIGVSVEDIDPVVVGGSYQYFTSPEC
ncbi:hypothetical protein B0H12DRAFT_375127 [Mycena haematopus]|nr:hypothetical protein B0H12DRAFT_375127 [Mycena haematopus]